MSDPLQVPSVDDFHDLIRIPPSWKEKKVKCYRCCDHTSASFIGGIISGDGLGVPPVGGALCDSHEAVTAAWSGMDGIGKETRLYLQRRFLTHSPNGPSFRIRVDPRRVI